MLKSLESRGESAGDPLRTVELQAMACLSVLHADISVKKLLKLLSDPQLVCPPFSAIHEAVDGHTRRSLFSQQFCRCISPTRPKCFLIKGSGWTVVLGIGEAIFGRA